MQNRSGKQAYDEAYLRCLQRTGSDLQAKSEAEEARQEQLRFNRARRAAERERREKQIADLKKSDPEKYYRIYIDE